MADLIAYDYRNILLLNRFNIKLGFKEKNIEQVCADSGVDTDCFLYIVNLHEDHSYYDKEAFEHLSAASVNTFLINAHNYFLNYRFPSIKEKLEKALQGADKVHTRLITKFFDDYVDEVKEHMEGENNTTFPYIEKVSAGKLDKGYSISLFCSHHEDIEYKLNELKNIIIKYLPPVDSLHLINDVLFDIFLCEEDLSFHTLVENQILVPLTERLEEKAKGGK